LNTDCGVVAKLSGKLVGAAWTRIIPAYGHLDESTPELAISILPNYRSQGVGTLLMNHLFDHVTSEKDDQPRAFVVPPYIEMILKDSGVLDAFLKQPDYLKREQLNKIELAKKEETKINRIQKLVAELEGK
jgi:GNAT superfamily N-acetyltransferase